VPLRTPFESGGNTI